MLLRSSNSFQDQSFLIPLPLTLDTRGHSKKIKMLLICLYLPNNFYLILDKTIKVVSFQVV